MPYVKEEVRAPFGRDLVLMVDDVRIYEDHYRDRVLLAKIKSLVTQTFYEPSSRASLIRDVAEQIRREDNSSWDGTLNYLVSELTGQSLRPDTGWRYHNLHRAYSVLMVAGAQFFLEFNDKSEAPQFHQNGFHRGYGVFMNAAAEFYRRMSGPYEDKAIQANGDITAYRDAVHP